MCTTRGLPLRVCRRRHTHAAWFLPSSQTLSSLTLFHSLPRTRTHSMHSPFHDFMCPPRRSHTHVQIRYAYISADTTAPVTPSSLTWNLIEINILFCLHLTALLYKYLFCILILAEYPTVFYKASDVWWWSIVCAGMQAFESLYM